MQVKWRRFGCKEIGVELGRTDGIQDEPLTLSCENVQTYGEYPQNHLLGSIMDTLPYLLYRCVYPSLHPGPVSSPGWEHP